MHDPTKRLLGATTSSAKDISNHDDDPATFPAGTAVRAKSNGGLSKASADGQFLGVSLGLSLDDKKRVAIVRTGHQVPILLTDAFVPTIGAPVHISDTTGLAIAAGAGATVTNAVYVSGVLTGLKEDQLTTARIATIDMPGGL